MLPVSLAGRQCLHRKEQRGNNFEGCILMRITEPAACCDTGNWGRVVEQTSKSWYNSPCLSAGCTPASNKPTPSLI